MYTNTYKHTTCWDSQFAPSFEWMLANLTHDGPRHQNQQHSPLQRWHICIHHKLEQNCCCQDLDVVENLQESQNVACLENVLHTGTIYACIRTIRKNLVTSHCRRTLQHLWRHWKQIWIGMNFKIARGGFGDENAVWFYDECTLQYKSQWHLLYSILAWGIADESADLLPICWLSQVLPRNDRDHDLSPSCWASRCLCLCW